MDSEAIYKTLETEIIDLRIKPGAMLSENDVCARFAVSRTPVRSVLQRLRENGLVEITPYKGSRVTLLSFDIVSQIIYQRVAVESMVMRDFMRQHSPLAVERVRHNITQMHEAVAQDGSCDVDVFYALDSEFHAIWFSETKKMYLWECIQKAQSNYSRFRMLDIVAVRNYADILAEHEEMLAILERGGQGDAAAQTALEDVLTRHLYGGVRRLGERIFTEFKEYFVDVE